MVINTRVLYDLAEVERWEAERTHSSTAEYESPRAVHIVEGARAHNEQRAQAQQQASAAA